MRELINVKLWPGRRAHSRAKWDKQNWEKRYSVTWGNRESWKNDKKRFARGQRRMFMASQMQR